MSTNRYGMDKRYLLEKLGQLVRDIESYRPEEMGRALRRLADAVNPKAAPTDKSLYQELLLEVVNKVPGETRHETARRIIREHETRDYPEASATPTDREE